MQFQMTGIDLPQLPLSQGIPMTAAESSIQRTTLMEIEKTTQTYLCSSWGYFNCHILSIIINSRVLCNDRSVGA